MANRDQLNQGLYIFVLIFCVNFITASEDCEKHENDYYAIKSVASQSLVLDAADPAQVRLQHFNGSDTQLWKFKPASRPGLYFVINKHQGKVLDFTVADDGRLHAAVSPMKDSLQQQWNVGTKDYIVNAANKKNIDIFNGEVNAGNYILVWEHNGNDWQKFLLQKKVI